MLRDLPSVSSVICRMRVVAIELEELAAAHILLNSERLAFGRLVVRIPLKTGSGIKGELGAVATGQFHRVNLVSTSAKRVLNQHFAARRMPARKVASRDSL